MRMLAVVLLTAAPAAAADDLSGKWEVQSMGADREMSLQQKGQKIVGHRVMWPEFEGAKYKLEHLFRGTIKGTRISGQLLVKEDELPEFEVLRDFTGSIESGDRITIDGMPMKRVGKAAAPAPSVESKGRPSEPPSFSQAAPPPPPEAPPPPAAAPPPPPPQDEASSLFASIMGSPGGQDIFTVSASIAIPNEASDLAADADVLYGKKRYREALVKYEEATKIGGSSDVALLHRMGRCHIALKQFTEAKVLLKRALKLDPHNGAIRKDYTAAAKRA